MSPQLPCRRNHFEASRPQTINTTRQTDPDPHTGDDNQSEYSSFEVETIETQWTNEYNQHTDITYLYGGSNNTTSSTAAWLEHRELKQRHYVGKLKKISNKLMSPDAKERAVNVFIENEVPENSRFREILTGVRTAWPSKPRNALFAKLDTIFGCHCVDSILENIEGKVMLDDDEDESMFTSNTDSMESFVSGKSFKWSAEDAETKEDKDLEISKD